jgi:acetylornithine deacetylase
MIRFNTVNDRPSPQGRNERPLAEDLQTLAHRWGLATHRLPVDDAVFNLLVYCQVDPAAPWLLFDSHLDTVAVEGMTIPPFDPQIRDGKIFGRGACDTKGSGAAMLWALRRYAQSDQRDLNIAIFFNVDEEVSKTGAWAFVNQQLSFFKTPILGVIVGEPTQLRLVSAGMGVLRWVIRTQGRAAHSSNPARGQSAISDMLRVVDALEQNYIPSLNARHPLTGKAQGSVNIIRGGTQINVIPHACEIHVDRRIVPGEDPATVLPAVERCLDELRQRHPQINVAQDQPLLVDPPLDPAVNDHFAPAVGAILREMNLDPTPTGVPYGTNASCYTSNAIPAVILGPGDIAQAHTADEFLALDQLERGIDLYYRLMCKTKDHWR